MRRACCVALGLATLALAWGLPPLVSARGFSAHMSTHVAVVAVAAPLLALGVAGGRYDPVRRGPGWFPPVPLSLGEFVVVWAWHSPALHHAAREHAAWRAVEQGSFLAAGFAVWLAAFGGGAALRSERVGAGVVALLLTSMHMTLLGALLALAPRALYPECSGATGLGAVDDQHLGGAIMLLVGGASYLLGGLWLTATLLRREATT
jgi:putative membrane protein